jgi:hypothetical protein
LKWPPGEIHNYPWPSFRGSDPGDVILHWDDDDWYASWRVQYQVEQMLVAGLDLCGLSRSLFVDAVAKEAWEVERSPNMGLLGGTFCYTRSLWQANPFPNANVGEDNAFWRGAIFARRGALRDHRFYVQRIHRSNTITRLPGPFGTVKSNPNTWKRLEIREVRCLLGPDWGKYFGGELGLPMGSVPDPPSSGVLWFYF